MILYSSQIASSAYIKTDYFSIVNPATVPFIETVGEEFINKLHQLKEHTTKEVSIIIEALFSLRACNAAIMIYPLQYTEQYLSYGLLKQLCLFQRTKLEKLGIMTETIDSGFNENPEELDSTSISCIVINTTSLKDSRQILVCLCNYTSTTCQKFDKINATYKIKYGIDFNTCIPLTLFGKSQVKPARSIIKGTRTTKKRTKQPRNHP